MTADKRAIDKIFRRRDRYEIPDWQRQKVWNKKKKQGLIDSILRGWKLPKFYFLLNGTSPKEYDVLDGSDGALNVFGLHVRVWREHEQCDYRHSGHSDDQCHSLWVFHTLLLGSSPNSGNCSDPVAWITSKYSGSKQKLVTHSITCSRAGWSPPILPSNTTMSWR